MVLSEVFGAYLSTTNISKEAFVNAIVIVVQGIVLAAWLYRNQKENKYNDND